MRRTQVGHPTALSAEQEEIVDICILFAEWGVGLGRREVEFHSAELPQGDQTTESLPG